MQDKSKQFEDFNFKLVVIEGLLHKECHFEKELRKLQDEYVANFEWHTEKGIIQEILSFCENLVLTENDLEKIDELCFDGGNEIYALLLPDWGGEDYLFDISSVKGFEKLVNLKKILYISMCEDEIMQPFIESGIEIS